MEQKYFRLTQKVSSKTSSEGRLKKGPLGGGGGVGGYPPNSEGKPKVRFDVTFLVAFWAKFGGFGGWGDLVFFSSFLEFDVTDQV
jgi:hypothetical protein